MPCLLLIVVLLVSGTITKLAAQQAVTQMIQLSPTATKYQSTPQPLPSINMEQPFIAYSLRWDASVMKSPVEIRFSKDRQRWSDWNIIEPDTHDTDTGASGTSRLYFAEANTRYVQWRTQVSASSEMTWRVFYPGHSETPSSPVIAPAPSDCPIALPDIQPRTVWCPDGQCPPNTTDLKVTATTHFIVHHSASANESNDWAAVVRSFWDFHVNTRNWSDIGYNYLIDPNGVLYEGRGEDIQGAHYCGKNQHTMGICVIGNFTNVSPTAAALATLTELMAWKSCKSNIDPLGESFQEPYGELLHHIEGHRAGCSTSCPGDSFYPTFDALRTDVAALLQPITSSSDIDVANMIMQLSPNPSTGLVHILINKLLGTAVNIEIWRVDGQQCILRKQLRTGMGNLELSFDLSGHPPGVYWVVLRQDNHRIHQTIVLQ